MHILPILLIASLLPAPLKSYIEKTIAAHRADPRHWQTTPLPPIRMPVGRIPNERVCSDQEDLDKAIEDFFRKYPDLRKQEEELKKKLQEKLQEMQPT